jgi:hypothetical protein
MVAPNLPRKPTITDEQLAEEVSVHIKNVCELLKGGGLTPSQAMAVCMTAVGYLLAETEYSAKDKAEIYFHLNRLWEDMTRDYR